MLSDKNSVIIFDGDDTLWKTQQLYDTAKIEFEKLMKVQGFPQENIIELLDSIDAERVEILRFSRIRFLESMLITYAVFCGKHNKSWNIHIESKIRELVLSIFSTPLSLYDDTVSTLETLSKSFDLVLFTVGDKYTQKEKINSLDKIKNYFLKIYISERKNDQEFKKIVDDLRISTDKVWVVGNSIKSDINPALKVGLKTILIPRGAWKYEEAKLLGDTTIVNSLIEAASIIKQKSSLKIKE